MFGTGGAIVHIKCAPLPLHCFFDGSVVSQSFIHAPSNQYFLCVGHDRSTSKVEGNVGKGLGRSMIVCNSGLGHRNVSKTQRQEQMGGYDRRSGTGHSSPLNEIGHHMVEAQRGGDQVPYGIGVDAIQ